MYPHLICRSSTNVRCSITRSGSHVVISKTTVFGELTSNSMNSAWRHSCCQVRLLDNFFLWFKPMLSWKQDPRPRWVPPVELKMGGETKNPGEFLRHLGDVHNLEIPNSWFLMENPQNENGWFRATPNRWTSISLLFSMFFPSNNEPPAQAWGHWRPPPPLAADPAWHDYLGKMSAENEGWKLDI